MKKLGLIGGVGPESTVDYYLGICQRVRERVGRDYVPSLTNESLSCFDVMGFAEAGELDALADYLVAGFQRLEAAGCEVGALCCNTGHIVFDAVQQRVDMPLVSIVDATVDAVRAAGHRRPLVLGTRATMEQPFLKRPLVKAGCAVLTPPPAERDWLCGVISSELERGIVREESAAHLAALIADGAEHGADCVVLGCTELPMLTRGRDLPVPVLDTTQVHVAALIDAVMGE